MKQARCIEVLLYRDASTFEEYVDKISLPRRIVKVVHQVKQNRIREDEIVSEVSKISDLLRMQRKIIS